ncbi:tetratricopeptide repeat protein [Streptomyces sp. NPDC059679]|uniref:tetratricopeptide repeat protein n=1 Tax=Streptomyces sp. NPDC059679 TaxID=3346903 RepID=UPI0036B0E746
MTAGNPNAPLLRANNLLATCEYYLRHFDGEREVPGLLADVGRCCDEAEEAAASGDEEAAATLAILRSMAATFALRRAALFTVACDFDDEDGTLLDGLGTHDKAGVSGPLATQAIQAARAALDADPTDPLVPLYLGHALTWAGDGDGAVAAYEEAMRRDPGDRCARSNLRYLDAAPGRRPPPSEMSHGGHGFALLRWGFWISNNDWDTGFLLFSSVAEARAHIDEKRYTDDVRGESDEEEWDEGDEEWDEGEDEDEGAKQTLLQIHRPGQRIAEYDLNARTQTGPGGQPLRIDWSDIPVDERWESSLPPGRPLRIDGRLCFYGGQK